MFKYFITFFAFVAIGYATADTENNKQVPAAASVEGGKPGNPAAEAIDPNWIPYSFPFARISPFSGRYAPGATRHFPAWNTGYNPNAPIFASPFLQVYRR